MIKRLHIESGWKGHCFFLAHALLFTFLHAQEPTLNFPQLPYGMPEEKKILDHYPEKPSLSPVYTIPVSPLGFSAPGPFYLLRRQSLVSLDFLDEDHLLFTFRVSGMIQRDADRNTEGQEQRIRAVTLAIPDGKLESEAEWIVPDRARYLWMLKDGHFLLRMLDGVDLGDTSLKLTPYLRFPGRLLWLEMDPTQQVLITNSLEPAPTQQEVGEGIPPAKTGASVASDGQMADAQSVLVARTLQRSSGELMRVLRVPWTHQTEDWPMNSMGYLERSQERGPRWLLKLNSFAGETLDLARVDSTCPPAYGFISDTKLLVTTCDPGHGWKLIGLGGNRDKLWEIWDTKAAWNAIWPLLVMAPNGSLVARETLLLQRSVDRYKRLLSAKDIQGQIVKVLDATNGKMVLEAPLTPMLDGGGNVAISPSGRRIAILNAGAIQLFQLPTQALPPNASIERSVH